MGWFDFKPVWRKVEFPGWKPRMDKGEVLRIRVKRKWLYVTKTQGSLVAFQTTCPHEGFSLGSAAIDQGKITCPLHRYCFDLKTGKALEPQDAPPLATYPIKEEGQSLWVKI